MSRKRIRTQAEKNRIRVKQGTKNYQKWLTTNTDSDELNPNEVWEGSMPWSEKGLPLSDTRMEALDLIRYELKGRQRQVLELLLDGVLNQTEIGKRLGIKQPTVAEYLQEIGKKILKKSLYIR